MRLAEIYGISPEDAAILEERNVHTLSDLASCLDLTKLSARSGIPINTLKKWHQWATRKVISLRYRQHLATGLGIFVFVSSSLLAGWLRVEKP
jgi:hypothetical protein